MSVLPWCFISGMLLLPGAPVTGAELPPARDIAPLIEARIPIAGDWSALGFDLLWVTNRNRVYRVDPADNSVKEIRLEGGKGHTRGLAVGEGAVWIASPGADSIYRVDPASESVTLKIHAEMLNTEGSIAVSAGSVWAVTQGIENRSEQTLSRFDTSTGETLARISLPAGGAGVLASEGYIWVTSPLTGQIFKINSSTNAVAATFHVGGSPSFIAAGEELAVGRRQAWWVGSADRSEVWCGGGEGCDWRVGRPRCRYRRPRRLRLGRVGQAFRGDTDRPGDEHRRRPIYKLGGDLLGSLRCGLDLVGGTRTPPASSART